MPYRTPAWLCVVPAAAVIALAMPACQSTSSDDGSNPLSNTDAEAGAPVDATSQPTPPAEIPVPPGVEESQVTELTGEARERVELPLSAILAEIDVPDYLQVAPDASTPDEPTAADSSEAGEPAESSADASDPDTNADGTADQPTDPTVDEPPLAAQRAYIAGRHALNEGQLSQATRQLEAALRLAPGESSILQLLGQVLTASGNKVEGARYLRQAARANPQDLESVYLLGRFAMEREQWESAVAGLQHVLQQEQSAEQPSVFDGDAAIEPLAHYHLGTALRQLGYARAALAQFEAFYDTADASVAGSRFGRELAFLRQQAGRTRIALGDLHLQLGELQPAAEQYDQAYESLREADQDLPLGLLKRVIYTDLKLGQYNQARQRLVEHIEAGDADEGTLSVVGYVQTHIPQAGPLIQALRGVYEQRDQTPALALAIAELMPSDEAASFLESHLHDNPNDAAVYDRLLADYLLPSDRETQEPTALARAIWTTASLMTAEPEFSDRYAVMLLRRSGEPGALSQGFESLTPEQAADPNAQVLRAMNLDVAGEEDQAADLLDQTLDEHPNLRIARIERAKLAISQGDYELARQQLEPIDDSQDSSVVALRVRVLAETGQLPSALDLLNEAIDQRGRASTELVLQKARLQLQLGRAEDAEQTLLDQLNDQPTEEEVYALLFRIYDTQPGMIQNYQQLMERMLRTIPNSRIARYKLAEWHAVQGEYARAENTVEQLLEEQPMDVNAIGLMVEIYNRTQRPDAASGLIERKLERSPRDRDLLAIAQELYRQRQELEKFYDVTERLMLLQPPSYNRYRTLVMLYYESDQLSKAVETVNQALEELDNEQILEPGLFYSLLWRSLLTQGDPERAERAIEAGVERFPEEATELRFQRAILVDRVGDRERSEQLLLTLLEDEPTHSPSANTLAYHYAVDGVNLDRALELVDTALDQMPRSSAYLDTKAWVLYKLGRFDEAEQWMRRSLQALDQEPSGGDPVSRAVLTDHLGDILYRLGEVENAVEAWEEVQELANSEQFPEDDPEVENIGERVRAKIQAVNNDGDQGAPPVAELPGEMD